MVRFETEHYIFHYESDTRAAADIERIAACQEGCFAYICNVLNTVPDFKIQYFLCDSPEAVGRIYGDDEPCNGFAAPPDRIYAVYNDRVQCIGFHEDAHIISYTIHRPDRPAVREGLAMYFDRKWWGIQNLDWVGYYLKTGEYLSVEQLLEKDFFFQTPCGISYPIMGAFTDYLIATYGRSNYLRFYGAEDTLRAMEEVYGKTPQELSREFEAYAGLFKLDATLEARMEELHRRQ